MIKKVVNAAAVLCLIIISLVAYHAFFERKVAYVEITKVFNGFVMKKELQEKFEHTHNLRKRIVDSLSFDLQLLSKKLQGKKDNDKESIDLFDTKRDYFLKKKKEVEEDNSALSSQYDKQILEQMTQYVLDYGKKNRYDLIFGSDSNGSLMYANEKYNISEEIITYINNRYKGVE